LVALVEALPALVLAAGALLAALVAEAAAFVAFLDAAPALVLAAIALHKDHRNRQWCEVSSLIDNGQVSRRTIEAG